MFTAIGSPRQGLVSIYKGTCKNQCKIAELSGSKNFGKAVTVNSCPTNTGWVIGAGDSTVAGSATFYPNECLGICLQPTESQVGDLYGSSVALYQDSIAVGAPKAKTVSLFCTQTGCQVLEPRQTLTGPESFGTSVVLGCKILAVGSPHCNSVFIYEKGEKWIQVAKLTGCGQFGMSLALHQVKGQWTLVVGAPNENAPFTKQQGFVYVYQQVNHCWVQKQKLRASDPASFGHFGASVALSEKYLVVGAPGNKGVICTSGAAYLFQPSWCPSFCGDWKETTKLLACDGQGGDLFGTSVDISCDTFAVGAPKRDAVYLYTVHLAVFCSETKQCTKILAATLEPAFFGAAVAIH